MAINYVKSGNSKLPDCHKLTEIYPNFWIGKYSHHYDMIDEVKIDVLVPLNDVSGYIWTSGWRGEVMYIPIIDFGVLPADVAVTFAVKIIDHLNAGRKVGMFCVGGHGRTGYMASLVLGLLKRDIDPIKYIRDKYCSKAIEADEQILQISEILCKPELLKHEPASAYDLGYSIYGSYSGIKFLGNSSNTDNRNCNRICYDCSYYYPFTLRKGFGECLITNKVKAEGDTACADDFADYQIGGAK